MSSRLIFMPFSFGILELILIAVLIVLIIKAVTGDNRGGKVIVGILVAIGTILLVPVLILGLMFVARSNTQTVVYNHQQAAAIAEAEQAKMEAARVRLDTQQMAAEIQAKADEIRQRTSVIVEDVATVTPHINPPVIATPDVAESYIEQPVVYEVPEIVTPQVVNAVEKNDQSMLRSYEDPNAGRVSTVAVSSIRTSGDAASESAVESSATEAGTTQVEVQSGMTVAGVPWTDAIEEYQDFEADIYPSMEDAAEALGRRVGQRLMQDLGDTEAEGADAPYVYVWRDEADGGDAAFISRDVLEAVARGLKQKMFDPAYVSVERPVNGTSVVVAIQELRFENHNRWRKQAESKSGGLALRVKTSDEAFSVSTRFADKPWLVDRSGFTHDFNNNPWLVAYSDSTHTQQSDAYWDAVHKAADAVLPMAEARISQLSGADQQRFHGYLAKDSNWLRDRVADELVSRNLVTDQFTQQFDKPAYTVWREAVLVNATPQQIEEIARTLVQGINVQVQHKRNVIFSYMALGVLILGTYLFLNVATKGYYTWSLRLALIISLGVVVFLFMSLA